nr:HAMP domain-containing sensor histidine kinase [Pontibacter harenae]
MSISLLGIVGLQLYWISDAIKVRQEQFDRSVNEVLSKVVEKLETQEAASVVADNMASLQKNASDTLSATLVKTETKTTEQPKVQHSENPKPEATAPKPAKAQGTGHLQSKTDSAAEPTGDKVLSNKSKKLSASVQMQNLSAVAGQGSSPIIYMHRSGSGVERINLIQKDSLKALQRYREAPSGRTTMVPAVIAGKGIKVVEHANSLFPDSLHLERNFPDSAFRALRSSKPDINFVRIHNQPIRVSVDTLKYMVSKLDSLSRNITFKTTLRPDDISSISVRMDSVFIYKIGQEPKVIYDSHAVPSQSKSVKGSGITIGGIRLKEAEKVVQAAVPAPEVKEVHTTKPAKKNQLHHNVSNISRIEIKKDKLNDVAQKMVVEYLVKDVPLKDRINLDYLPSLLKTELQNQGININFGYWVVSGESDTVVAQNTLATQVAHLPKYTASLFPNDIFDKTDQLGIYFPDSKTYALKSLWGMLTLSALFTMVIVATFGTTIHIIYKQKKLSEMKNDFINNMTHEFKTPIATISLATDSISNPKVYENPDRIKYYTNIIREENKRMNGQVENVLQIALLEKNEFKMNLQPVDVHLLIVKAIESIKLQVEQRYGQIWVQLEALEHELNLDEVHLYNVICNLLDNANKYSPTEPIISLTTSNKNGGLLIAVEDKGIGMSKDAQQRVFEKFYRVPTGNLHNVKGFGLGLSYVKAIVQAHHGDIKLKSEPGKGSRFEVFLPLS